MHRPEAAAAVLPKQVHCPETASRLGSGPCGGEGEGEGQGKGQG